MKSVDLTQGLVSRRVLLSFVDGEIIRPSVSSTVLPLLVTAIDVPPAVGGGALSEAEDEGDALSASLRWNMLSPKSSFGSANW